MIKGRDLACGLHLLGTGKDPACVPLAKKCADWTHATDPLQGFGLRLGHRWSVALSTPGAHLWKMPKKSPSGKEMSLKRKKKKKKRKEAQSNQTPGSRSKETRKCSNKNGTKRQYSKSKFLLLKMLERDSNGTYNQHQSANKYGDSSFVVHVRRKSRVGPACDRPPCSSSDPGDF